MPIINVDGITLDYDRRGDADGPTLLMIMGLGAQRIAWPEELLDDLAGRGFDVVSFDNRDVGGSTWLDGPEIPGSQLGEAFVGGAADDPPYTLADLATDAVGLLDALGIDQAHVVGASMGGMVAQHLAISHADRVASLTSIMSTTGDREVGQPSDAALEVLMTRPPMDREGFVEATVDSSRVISSPTLFDEDRARARAERIFERGVNPPGTGRQLYAILADGDRTQRLGEVDVPTLVIHGAQDPLIDVSGGKATADAIADAKLLVLDEMGHDLPLPLLGEIGDAIADHVTAVEAA